MGHADFCVFLHFAHRAFWAAAIRLRAAGDIVCPLRLAIDTTFCPLTFAQRARCAAAIRARPPADILPLRNDPLTFSADSALLTLSSCDLRRPRSCSSWLSTELRLVIHEIVPGAPDRRDGRKGTNCGVSDKLRSIFSIILRAHWKYAEARSIAAGPGRGRVSGPQPHGGVGLHFR